LDFTVEELVLSDHGCEKVSQAGGDESRGDLGLIAIVHRVKYDIPRFRPDAKVVVSAVDRERNERSRNQISISDKIEVDILEKNFCLSLPMKHGKKMRDVVFVSRRSHNETLRLGSSTIGLKTVRPQLGWEGRADTPLDDCEITFA
jgi:hypothetical protein